MTFARALTTLMILNLVAVVTVRCSNQVSSSDPGVDASLMSKKFSEAVDQVTAQTNGQSHKSTLNALYQNKQTQVYYATNMGTMGNAASILAFNDLQFLASDLKSISQVVEVHVYFLDLFDDVEGSRETALLFNVTYKDASGKNVTVYRSFVQVTEVSISKKFFEVILEDEKGTELTVSTQDILDDSLALDSVIQLRLDVNEKSTGTTGYLGKISTLVDYGA